VIVIAGSATIRPDKLQAAAEAARVMREASLAEPGCNAYRFAVDLDDPSVLTIFEEWVDEPALQAHFATPHLVAFSEALTAVVAGEIHLRRYEVSSAGPLFG
jgi:quinol monooxygenase YgiN